MRQRRVAVPMFQRRLAEPFGLERVIAMREARIGGAHGGHQRIDDLALDPVGKMPCVGDVAKTAPAIGNFLVLRQRVGDQRKCSQIFLQADAKGDRRLFTGFFVLILHEIEDGLDRQGLAIDGKTQARDCLVEQPVPGAITGDRFFMKQLLELVVELIGLALADVLKPGPVMFECPRRQFGGERVVEPVQFEFEEQKIRRRVGDLFLRVAIEFHPRRVGRIAGVNQPGIGHDAPEQFFQRLVTLDGVQEASARSFFGERLELALVGGTETFAFRLRLDEVARESRRLHGRVKVFEIPLRQAAKIRLGLGFRGHFRPGAEHIEGSGGGLARHGTILCRIAVIASKALGINRVGRLFCERWRERPFVMPGLEPGAQTSHPRRLDGRAKPGHDGLQMFI